MCRSKINITIAFEHANVLEIQDISCKRWANFRHFEPHLTPRVPPKKDCSILLNVRRNRISHEILSTRANLQLLWVIISGIVNFDPFGPPFDVQSAPKTVKICNLSLMRDIMKALVRNYFSVHICCFWGYF